MCVCVCVCVRARAQTSNDIFLQMLLILQMILDRNGGVDKLDFAKRIQNWRSHGFSEFGDLGGMGIGMTVSRTLSHSQFLTDPHAAAIDVWERSG